MYTDISGHIVSEKGYLIEIENNNVNRKWKIIFKNQELINGEFPKIFIFSKFDM